MTLHMPNVFIKTLVDLGVPRSSDCRTNLPGSPGPASFPPTANVVDAKASRDRFITVHQSA